MVTSTSFSSTPTTLNVLPGAIFALPETFPFTVSGTMVSFVKTTSCGRTPGLDLCLGAAVSDWDGSADSGAVSALGSAVSVCA